MAGEELAFGDFRLDLGRRELTRRGTLVERDKVVFHSDTIDAAARVDDWREPGQRMAVACRSDCRSMHFIAPHPKDLRTARTLFQSGR